MKYIRKNKDFKYLYDSINEALSQGILFPGSILEFENEELILSLGLKKAGPNKYVIPDGMPHIVGQYLLEEPVYYKGTYERACIKLCDGRGFTQEEIDQLYVDEDGKIRRRPPE